MPDDALSHVRELHRWVLPSHGLMIETIDAHCGGEPLRIVLGGFPTPSGRTMIERRRRAIDELDHLRCALVHEPRGHARQYAALLTPPERPDSHFGVLFFHGGGFRPVSGHGIIALATALVECGLVPMVGPETRLKFDTPAGLVRAFARIDNDRVRGVFFENVPSFAVEIDATTTVPGIGEVRYDLAFGGLYYAFVRAPLLGLSCVPEQAAALRAAAKILQAAIGAASRLEHPVTSELNSLGGVVFVDDPPRRRGADQTSNTRQACVFAEGEINRSPGGASVSARMAVEHVRGRLELGRPLVVESLVGTIFTGKAAQETSCGAYRAIITEIEGTAFVTGFSTIFIDPSDPLREGFVIG